MNATGHLIQLSRYNRFLIPCTLGIKNMQAETVNDLNFKPTISLFRKAIRTFSNWNFIISERKVYSSKVRKAFTFHKVKLLRLIVTNYIALMGID